MSVRTENHTWALVDLPSGKRAIGCRWCILEKIVGN